MLPGKIIRPISFVLVILYFASCTTTYEVTRRSELNIPDDLGDLTVTSIDNKIYTMEHYRLDDSVITYTGTVEFNNSEKPSSGSLKLSEIKKIEATEGSLGKTVLIVGAAAAVIITFIAFLNHENGLKNDVVIKYPGGGCGSMSDRLLPENAFEPVAAGFSNIIDENITPESRKMYLDVMNKDVTYHFTVINKTDRIEIETLNEPAENINSSDKITLDFRNMK